MKRIDWFLKNRREILSLTSILVAIAHLFARNWEQAIIWILIAMLWDVAELKSILKAITAKEDHK